MAEESPLLQKLSEVVARVKAILGEAPLKSESADST